jgi:hypothetical protein
MSAAEFFASARSLKREMTGFPSTGLTQEEVDNLNAVIQGWKLTERAPTDLHNAAGFYTSLRSAFGPLSQQQVDGITALLKAMGGVRWPIAWVAYGLATAWHETAKTMQPIKEFGGPEYFRKMYDPQGARPDVAKRLGNIHPGDGALFAGRGYVQLTGRANYAKAGEYLKANLEGDPALAMDADYAARILTWGMEHGAFTGKGLKDFLPIGGRAGHDAYASARRIINGQDKAAEIAKIALSFEAALDLGGWG